MYSKTLVFTGSCLGMLLFGVSLITLGSMATELQAKFSLDALGAGTIFSLLPFGILAGSFIFGPVGDRWGYKALLILACFGMFLGFQGIAFANELLFLQVSIFIFGVGGGVINGTTNALVADISKEKHGANLSLLGVFFGLGALGMPLVLGAAAGIVSSFYVIALVGVFTLVVAGYYALIAFPPAKLRDAPDAFEWKQLASPLLIVIAFFLFCQSSLEAIINNWTTTYVTSRGVMSEANALYALSLHIVGMVVMRLLMGSLFRNVSQVVLMWTCLLLLFVGVLLMQVGGANIATLGLVLSGAGVAGGFPIMLGFVGERYAAFSGTAFSFVFVVALIGNMLINYLTGVIIQTHGVEHLVTVSYVEIAVMAALFVIIIRNLKVGEQ